MKRLLPWILLDLIIGYLGLVFFANQGIYGTRFDPAYWKDRFDHSQWKLPQSERGIGDDGLYLYQGYVLMKGADPSRYNPEVPPLGKYMIGSAIEIFQNGQMYGFVSMTLALMLFFVCTKVFLRDTVTALGTTLLFALDPLITSQFATTMLESGQLVFFLFTSLSLLFIDLWIVVGFAFGAFSAVKFPLLAPIIGLSILLIIRQKTKRMLPIALFLMASTTMYLIPYLRYFLLGHSLTDWLSLQKWIFNFYMHANLTPNIGSFATILATGWIQSFFTRSWERAMEWTPVWPFIFGTTLLWCFINWKKHRALVSSIVFAMIVYAIIPFWTRYLVLFLPLFYLVTVAAIAAHAKRLLPIMFILILATNGIVSFGILFPTPQATVNQLLFDWKHGFFQDMYEQLSNDSQKNISREAFHRFGLQTFLDGQIEKVEITSDAVVWSRFRSPQTVRLNIIYTTRNLGSFTEKISLPVIKEQNRWRIKWDWNVLINRLTNDTHLETNVQQAKRGSIVEGDGTMLAQDIPSVLVSVIPEKIDSKQEEAMLKFLESKLDQRVAAIGLYRRYMQNSLPDQPVPLGVIMKHVDNTTYNTLLAFPGIRLIPWFGRTTIGTVGNSHFFECCSLLYNTTAYDGTGGLEQQYNDALKGENGGSLVIKDQNRVIIRTILKKEKRDGKTVRL